MDGNLIITAVSLKSIGTLNTKTINDDGGRHLRLPRNDLVKQYGDVHFQEP